MDGDQIAASVAEIQGLMRDRLRINARTLQHQIKKAGRLLPRAVSRDARYLAQAATLSQNPKLARMVDPARLEEAHARVVDHLKGVDPAERRKDRWLRFAGMLAFNFLVIGGALVAYLVWRGHV